MPKGVIPLPAGQPHAHVGAPLALVPATPDAGWPPCSPALHGRIWPAAYKWRVPDKASLEVQGAACLRRGSRFSAQAMCKTLCTQVIHPLIAIRSTSACDELVHACFTLCPGNPVLAAVDGWLDMAKLVAGGGATKTPYDEFASAIGENGGNVQAHRPLSAGKFPCVLCK